MKCYYYLLLLCLFFGRLNAQTYKSVTYQTEQGLATNLTKMVFQDQKGFVWICTDAGIMRYDGRQFIQYKEQFASQYMKAVYLSSKGVLYLVHDLGLEVIDNQVDSVAFHKVLGGGAKPTDSTLVYPKSIYESANGNLWFGEPENVACYDLKTQKVKRYAMGSKNQTSSFTRSYSFASDGFGSFYAISQQGFLYYYDNHQDKFLEIAIPNKSFASVNALLQNKQGELLVGADTGLFALSVTPQGRVLSCDLVYSNTGISSLTKDLHHNIFIGTWNSGLFRANFDRNKLQVTKIDNITSNVINNIYATPQGELWVSTDDGISFLYITLFTKLNLPFERIYMQDVLVAEAENTVYLSDGADIYELAIDSKSKFIDPKLPYKIIYSETDGDILTLEYLNGTVWAGNSRGEIIKVNKNKTEKIGLGDKYRSVFSLYGDENHVWIGRYDSDTLLKINNQTNAVQKYTNDKGIISPPLVSKKNHQGILHTAITRGSHGRYLLEYDKTKDTFIDISKPIAAKVSANWQITDMVFNKEDKVFLGTNHGLFVLHEDSLRKVPLDRDYEIKSIFFDHKQMLWIGTDVGLLRQQNNGFVLFNEFNGLSSKTMTYRAIAADSMNRIWVATANGICFSQLEVVEKRQTPKPIFLNIQCNGQRVKINSPEIIFENNSVLVASFVTMNFPTDRILYQYRISNINNNQWTSPETTSELIVPNLGFGNYTLEIRALQQGGYGWSEPLQLNFSVNKPYYLTWWAIIGYLLLTIFLIWLIVKLYSQKLVKEKEHLEQIVSERTDEIKKQADAIFKVHQTLEKKNKDVLASINYAKRIQNSMMPTLEDFEKRFGNDNFFILFKPRDIVSGDFYWLAKVRKEGKAYLILAVADCTGHGVPGALVSMVGCNILNNLVKENLETSPSRILTLLDKEVRKTLQQDKGNSRDGMDMALITLQYSEEQKNNTSTFSHLTYASAMNPLYYIQKGVIYESKATKLPIGGSENTEEKVYEEYNLVIDSDTYIYLCSDGYQDQFGGGNDKKYMKKRLREVLLQNHSLPMSSQYTILQTNFEEWRGKLEQVDDVTIIGFKI